MGWWLGRKGSAKLRGVRVGWANSNTQPTLKVDIQSDGDYEGSLFSGHIYGDRE